MTSNRSQQCKRANSCSILLVAAAAAKDPDASPAQSLSPSHRQRRNRSRIALPPDPDPDAPLPLPHPIAFPALPPDLSLPPLAGAVIPLPSVRRLCAKLSGEGSGLSFREKPSASLASPPLSPSASFREKPSACCVVVSSLSVVAICKPCLPSSFSVCKLLGEAIRALRRCLLPLRRHLQASPRLASSFSVCKLPGEAI